MSDLPRILSDSGLEGGTDRTDAWPKQDDLLTQSEARALSSKLNETWDVQGTGMCHVAHPVPAESWGGHEKGWSVSLTATSPRR